MPGRPEPGDGDGGRRSPPPLIRFLLQNALLGIAVGWMLLAALILGDAFGLGALLRASSSPLVALALLALGFAVTFGGAAMATAVFLIRREPPPR